MSKPVSFVKANPVTVPLPKPQPKPVQQPTSVHATLPRKSSFKAGLFCWSCGYEGHSYHNCTYNHHYPNFFGNYDNAGYSSNDK
ncbi:hypothetical protein ABFV55_27630, partial [Pseudomonas syringae]|uniref:hypothetical protein n=1 Tax=Pseudomonas syringae TaxID=317 RepID=UPI0034D98503